MVVVPIDADVNKTQHIAAKDRQHGLQSRKPLGLRDFELQYHDGDDDREHPVAECFKPVGCHEYFLGNR